MSAQLSLYEAPEPLDDLRAQLMRAPQETRVLIDVLSARGGLRFEALGDGEVEAERLKRAATAGLRWQWTERYRGLRRQWLRRAKDDETRWIAVDGLAMLHLAYEPRLERPLGVKGKQSEQRFYWPRRLP